jgi:hypothetical protein
VTCDVSSDDLCCLDVLVEVLAVGAVIDMTLELLALAVKLGCAVPTIPSLRLLLLLLLFVAEPVTYAAFAFVSLGQCAIIGACLGFAVA